MATAESLSRGSVQSDSISVPEPKHGAESNEKKNAAPRSRLAISATLGGVSRN